jgi:hypothetical protein
MDQLIQSPPNGRSLLWRIGGASLAVALAILLATHFQSGAEVGVELGVPSEAAMTAWREASSALDPTERPPEAEPPHYVFEEGCILNYEVVFESKESFLGEDGSPTDGPSIQLITWLDAVVAEGLPVLRFVGGELTMFSQGEPDTSRFSANNEIPLRLERNARAVASEEARHRGWRADGGVGSPGLALHFPAIPDDAGSGSRVAWHFDGGSNETIETESVVVGWLDVGGESALMIHSAWDQSTASSEYEWAGSHEVLAVVLASGKLLWAYYGEATTLDSPVNAERDERQVEAELRLVGSCSGPVLDRRHPAP